MAITSYKEVVGYYNSAGTPNITTAVTGQLSSGWIPVGSPILTDTYGQCTQMMVKTDDAPAPSTSAYIVVTAANPQPPDATWDAQGEPLWIDTATYLQAYSKGSGYIRGVLPVIHGGTGATTAAGATTNIGAFAIANNLSEVTNRTTAWLNIRPTGALPLAADPVGNLDATTKGWTESYVYNNRTTTIEGLTGGTVNGGVYSGGGQASVGFTSNPSNTFQESPGVFRNIFSQTALSAFQYAMSDFVVNNNAGRAYVRLIPFASPSDYYVFSFDHTGEATARVFTPTSDERLKTDIKRVENPLDTMRNIKGVTFRYKDSGIFGIGFIAQDIERVFPDAVSKGGDLSLSDGTTIEGVKRPDTYGVAAALHHEAILALMDKIEALEARIASLESGK